MKTKEELNAIKEELEALNKKLNELSEDELAEVTGGKDKRIKGYSFSLFTETFHNKNKPQQYEFNIYDNNLQDFT